MKGDPKKRRKDQRLETALTVQVRSAGRRCYGTMYDVSTNGAFIAVDSPPGAGALLRIAIRMADHSDLMLDAVVRYSTSDQGNRLSAGVGLEFIDLSDEQRDVILGIVERIKSGRNARGTDGDDLNE